MPEETKKQPPWSLQSVQDLLDTHAKKIRAAVEDAMIDIDSCGLIVDHVSIDLVKHFVAGGVSKPVIGDVTIKAYFSNAREASMEHHNRSA